MTGRTQHPLDRLLQDVIGEEGGTCRPSDIRDELVAVIERVTAELEAAGQEMTEFCHWSVNEGVGVFIFVGEELGIYVVPCPANRQWELINRFDRMPATDVEAYRARLNARYGKSKPDLVIKPDLAYDWLYGERAADAGEGATEELWTGELWTTGLHWKAATSTEEAAAEGAEAGEGTAEAPSQEGTPAVDETTTAASSAPTAPPEAAAVEPEDSLETLLGAPSLEEMMAAIRAAGGGKGRPIRRSDFD